MTIPSSSKKRTQEVSTPEGVPTNVIPSNPTNTPETLSPSTSTISEDDATSLQPVQESPDLPGYEVTATDLKLKSLYGEYVHANAGTHLTGGITDDKFWQDKWNSLCALPPHLYDVPKHKVGRHFVAILSDELQGIIDRKWNAERFLTFQTAVLVKHPNVRKASDIKRRLATRLGLWEKGRYTELVEDSISALEASLCRFRGTSAPNTRMKVYHNLVLRGELRKAVRYLTDRKCGGVLNPDDIGDDKGRTVEAIIKN